MSTLSPVEPDNPPEPERLIVRVTIAAIIEFAGGELGRREVRDILRHCRHYPELTATEAVTVLKAFPGRGDPGTLARGDAHPMMHHNGRGRAV